MLQALEAASRHQHVGCDCYPYTASSSTLDLKQVTSDYDIQVTWSEPHPEQGGKMLKQIAADWGVDLHAAAARLMPAGAVYHCMSDDDVNRILSHPATVVGSDGLPNDPLPHPRLWGAFPRVLGHYSRDLKLFPLEDAVRRIEIVYPVVAITHPHTRGIADRDLLEIAARGHHGLPLG